jgi:hypothetical protein
VALNVTSSFLRPASEAELTQFVEKTVASLAPSANIPTSPLIENTDFLAGSATNGAMIVTAAEPVTNAASALALIATNTLPTVTSVNPQTEVARTIHELVQKAGNGTSSPPSRCSAASRKLSTIFGASPARATGWCKSPCIG